MIFIVSLKNSTAMYVRLLADFLQDEDVCIYSCGTYASPKITRPVPGSLSLVLVPLCLLLQVSDLGQKVLVLLLKLLDAAEGHLA